MRKVIFLNRSKTNGNDFSGRGHLRFLLIRKSYRQEFRKKEKLVCGPFVVPYSYFAQITAPIINPCLSFVV